MFKEKDMEDIIASEPDEILGEKGLVLLGRQISIGSYRFDLMFTDRHGAKLIVEIQKGTLDRGHTYKILDYYDEYKEKNPREFVEIMIVANVVPPERKRRLVNRSIPYKEIPEDIFISRMQNKITATKKVTIPKDHLDDDLSASKGTLASEFNFTNKLCAKFKEVFCYPRFYFRTHQDKSDEYNFSIENNSFSLDDKSFLGFIIFSQHRFELFFISTLEIQKLRNSAFEFRGGIWIRKKNVLDGKENRNIYIKIDDESYTTGTLKCKCADGQHILISCNILQLKNFPTEIEVIENIAMDFVTSNA